MAFFLESIGCNVTAIDWPGTSNNHLSGFVLMRSELGSSVRLREIDVDSQFELDGERFGLVFALGLLYHLKNPYYFLETLAIHSRHVLLSTRILPKGSTADPIARLVGDREFENDPSNFWFFSEPGILRLLDRCGWDVSTSRVTGDGDDDRFFCLAESRSGRTKPTIRLLEGWNEMEKRAWRWTTKECAAVIENVPGATQFEFRFLATEQLIGLAGTLTVEATVNGEQLGPETYRTAGSHVYTRKILLAPRRCEVRIRLSHTSAPDGRELGVVVRLPPSTIIDDDCGLRLDP